MLARANLRGSSEAIVANITQLVVVIAAAPQPDLFVMDRYLCAASSAQVMGLIVVNKSDLGISIPTREERAGLSAAGYRIVDCSATNNAGLVELRATLVSHVSVLVGQSGVGKSSLVGALIPQSDTVVGSLLRDEEGRHTTTASRCYPLAAGGSLIDSPGVRDFAPAIDRLDPRSLGFPEIERLAAQCRFQDCQHMREPSCAVSGAASSGAMLARRYESYRRLRRLYQELTTARGPQRSRR
jgi:ribosome biogenesis GTPase